MIYIIKKISIRNTVPHNYCILFFNDIERMGSRISRVLDLGLGYTWFHIGFRVVSEGLQPRTIIDKSVTVKQLSVVEPHGLLILRTEKGIKFNFTLEHILLMLLNIFNNCI